MNSTKRQSQGKVCQEPSSPFHTNYSPFTVYKLILSAVLVLQNCFNFKFSSHYYTNSDKKWICSEDPVFQDKEL